MVPLKQICHFKINTEKELIEAIKELEQLTIINEELQQDLFDIVRNRNSEHYLKLIRENGLRHGVSVIETQAGELLLIFYQFSRGGTNHGFCRF